MYCANCYAIICLYCVWVLIKGGIMVSLARCIIQYRFVCSTLEIFWYCYRLLWHQGEMVSHTPMKKNKRMQQQKHQKKEQKKQLQQQLQQKRRKRKQSLKGKEHLEYERENSDSNSVQSAPVVLAVDTQSLFIPPSERQIDTNIVKEIDFTSHRGSEDEVI